MPKIQRKTQKVFCNSADSDQLAVFGSMSTGTPVYSSDVEELQSNEAFDLGWAAATLEDKAPFMEEMNGVQYGLTYQIAYGLQEGIPEYDSATTYYIGSICKVLEDGKPILYTSLTDDNIGNNPVNDSTNWERLSFGGGGLEIGDVGFTQMAIDESKGKRRILNGQLIIQDQYLQLTNIIKNSVALNPDLACTEAEWQTELTMSANGVCYKYVIDDEAGTIRLPKYPDYLDLSINGAKTVSVYGNGKTLGLTDKEANFAISTGHVSGSNFLHGTTSGYGVASGTSVGNTGWINPTQKAVGVVTDSTKSGITGSVTTSSEQIRGTYFIQVATGTETEENIVNEIELNNPFSLLDYKYSEYELNNLSWLRSEGQYNYKAIYPAVYDLLLKIYNGVETKAGVSVKLTTEAFTDYDFVLNTAEETFRLPIKVKLASGKAVVGNGMTLGLTALDTNSTTELGNFGLAYSPTSNIGLTVAKQLYGESIGYGIDSLTSCYPANQGVSVTTDPTKSGIETSDSDLYLYFYVGETVQNANLVNIGRIQETYTTKSMVDGQWVSFPEIIEVGSPKSLGAYTFDISNYLPNDGYIYDVFLECGGKLSKGGTGTIAMNVSSSVIPHNCKIAQMNGDDSANQFDGVAISLPIGTDRVLTVELAGSSGVTLTESYVYLYAYRRLGTNL